MVECAACGRASRDSGPGRGPASAFGNCVRASDYLPFRNEHDAIDVALDGHHPVGEGPRDAVAIAVEGDGLVLVHSDRGIDHAGVERMLGQGRCRGEVLGQTGLDQERTEERLHGPLTLGLAALAENRFNSSRSATRGRGGERRRTALTVPSASGLSLPRAACSNGVEDVVTGERGDRGGATFGAFEDQRGDRFWVVRPDLLGNGAKELEGGDHAMEDRFGALARQGDHEGAFEQAQAATRKGTCRRPSGKSTQRD